MKVMKVMVEGNTNLNWYIVSQVNIRVKANLRFNVIRIVEIVPILSGQKS